MAQFRVNGAVWQLNLTHEEVGYAHDGARIATLFSAGPFPHVAAAIESVSGVVRTVDALGGYNGVNVIGVGYTQFLTITPAFISPIGLISGLSRRVEEATGLPGGVLEGGIGSGFAWLAAGPAAAVVVGLASALRAVGGGGGVQPGDVHADRRGPPGPWEKFMLVALSGNKVAIGSWRGFFAAENGGGRDVHANRHLIGPWENFILERNQNNTVSFRHEGGHYLVAEGGGGDHSFCNWNRTSVGPWEQFWKEDQPDGTFALKTFVRGTYVSVQ